MSNQNKTGIERPKGWVSQFDLYGTVKPNENSFKINQSKEGSSYVYNSMNLGVFCGEKFGTVFADAIQGYDSAKESVIFAHGKDENGRDDYDNRIEVAWNDRLDEDITKEIGLGCFIRVGLERQSDGKLFVKNFLSAYDAIAYIKENLSTEEETLVHIKGRLKYSFYNDKVQVKKEITAIYLTDREPKDYEATFKQSVLLDKESASAKDIDKSTGVMPVSATILDYLGKVNGVDFKAQYPFVVPMEYVFDLTNKELTTKVYNKLFKVKKGYTMITFVGNFIESGAIIKPTLDDIPDDIKELIDLGIYSEEDALKACADNGSRVRRMVLVKPEIRLDDEKNAIVQLFTEVFDDGDLDVVLPAVEEADNDEAPFDTDETVDTPTTDGDDDPMAWLNNL